MQLRKHLFVRFNDISIIMKICLLVHQASLADSGTSKNVSHTSWDYASKIIKLCCVDLFGNKSLTTYI